MCKILYDSFACASEETFGNISAIARRLGVARSTLYKYITANPEARSLIESHREAFDDVVEETLQRKILEGNDQLLKFYLQSRLRVLGRAAVKKKPPEFTVTFQDAEK